MACLPSLTPRPGLKSGSAVEWHHWAFFFTCWIINQARSCQLRVLGPHFNLPETPLALAVFWGTGGWKCSYVQQTHTPVLVEAVWPSALNKKTLFDHRPKHLKDIWSCYRCSLWWGLCCALTRAWKNFIYVFSQWANIRIKLIIASGSCFLQRGRVLVITPLREPLIE